MINIDIQQTFVSLDRFAVKTYNFQGHLLQQSIVQAGHNQIDFSKHQRGIYLVVIEKNHEVIAIKKLVK